MMLRFNDNITILVKYKIVLKLRNSSYRHGIDRTRIQTLKDKITPGSRTAPDFIITPSHTIACWSLQPSSMLILSHI